MQVEITSKKPTNEWQFKGYVEWPPGSGRKAGTVWAHRLVPNLNVFRSVAKMKNGSSWIHLSVSRLDKMPTLLEVFKAKEDFIDDFKRVVIGLSDSGKNSLVNEHCVHLWSPIVEDEQALDFMNEITGEDAI